MRAWRIRGLSGAMLLTLLATLMPLGAAAGDEQVSEPPAADSAAASLPVVPDGFHEAGARLQKRLDAAPGINGGLRYDESRKAFVVALVADSNATQKQALRSELRNSLRGDDSFEVVFDEAPAPFADQMELMRAIAASPEVWGRRLGATVNGAYVDHNTHEVVIWVASKPSAATERAASAITGPVRLEVSGPIVPLAGDRRHDLGGWTAGNWLHIDTRPSTGDAFCTLGFTWRVWGVGGQFGGMARHCIVNPVLNHLNWWHNGRFVGSLYRTASNTDGALLAPASGTSFNASVWVGGPATTDERVVRGVATVHTGRVALSGANSGLSVGTIFGTASSPGFGNNLILVTRPAGGCEGGDSGGSDAGHQDRR